MERKNKHTIWLVKGFCKKKVPLVCLSFTFFNYPHFFRFSPFLFFGAAVEIAAKLIGKKRAEIGLSSFIIIIIFFSADVLHC